MDRRIVTILHTEILYLDKRAARISQQLFTSHLWKKSLAESSVEKLDRTNPAKCRNQDFKGS